MSDLILAMPENDDLAHKLAGHLGGEVGRCEIRRFPDGESFVRIDSEVKGRAVTIACTLDRPDGKFLALSFLAAAARDLGGARVGLVAPYLPYMRQDTRFHPGEGVTSSYFARLLGRQVDWLVTMDPHLHRRKSLSEIYNIATSVAHAGPAIADWVRANVEAPVIIGPDSESEQWVAEVAAGAGAPYGVLQKVRTGDREVTVSMPSGGGWDGRVPVLVDDIISTARTMIAAARQFREAGHSSIVAIGVHALFADSAYDELRESGVDRIATCNTVIHRSNAIDITAHLAAAAATLSGDGAFGRHRADRPPEPSDQAQPEGVANEP